MDKPVSTARVSDWPITYYSRCYVCCHPQMAGCLRFRFNRDFPATSYAPGTAPPRGHLPLFNLRSPIFWGAAQGDISVSEGTDDLPKDAQLCGGKARIYTSLNDQWPFIT